MFLVSRFESTLTTVNASLAREVNERTQSLVRTRNAVVFGLAKLSESKDKDTAGHLERIRSYVTFLASHMAKTNSEITHHYVANLAVASALHDIGKVGVPDAVLLEGGPADAQRAARDADARRARRRMPGRDPAAAGRRRLPAARPAGGGRPPRAVGRQRLSRTACRARRFRWRRASWRWPTCTTRSTSHRPYRPALSHAEAREWIVSHYGTQFDPEVVEAFVAREADFARLSQTASKRRPRAMPAACAGAAGGRGPSPRDLTACQAVRSFLLGPC